MESIIRTVQAQLPSMTQKQRSDELCMLIPLLADLDDRGDTSVASVRHAVYAADRAVTTTQTGAAA